MARICILIDKPNAGARAAGRSLTEFDESILNEKMRKGGISPDDMEVQCLETIISSFINNEPNAIQYLNGQSYHCIVPMGEKSLEFVTGKKSLQKWHLSPLDTLPEFTCRRAMPTFHPDSIRKEWHLGFYMERAFQKVATDLPRIEIVERSGAPFIPVPWVRTPERFVLAPAVDEAIALLESIRHNPWHSLDIETGRGIINTFGIAWSESDAVALKVLPGDLPPAAHHKIWSLIIEICESDSRKILQNAPYERSYASRYGFNIQNVWHDTMVCSKFLYPEFNMGLDNVGRIFTMEPYWKDDGKVESEEGKRKDWGNIRDWHKHLVYNCRDTRGTAIAAFAQRKHLVSRGLEGLHDNYLRELFTPLHEMSVRGLPLNTTKRESLVKSFEAESVALCGTLSKPINPRSSKQKIQLLKDKNYKLPTNKKSGNDSADILSLLKLRLKHPEDTDLKTLIDISRREKELSSYLRVKTLSDNRIRYQFNSHGAESGRFSCNKDAWYGGFNGQTLTDTTKTMIEWSETAGRIFFEVDLDKAETRFVAYDSCDVQLLKMLGNGDDIHSFVAARIFKVPVEEIIMEAKAGILPTKALRRQLGKKSGHAANYSVGINTLVDSCLKEMDLVITPDFARRMLTSYHDLFPGIRRWHASIKKEIYNKRCLTTPFGRVRYFYGRMEDATYREGYAYRPQSCVPDIINTMMLGMCKERAAGRMDFWLHLQKHDSILGSCLVADLDTVARYCANIDLWHPVIKLPAGILKIPVEVKTGTNLGEMRKWKPSTSL